MCAKIFAKLRLRGNIKMYGNIICPQKKPGFFSISYFLIYIIIMHSQNFAKFASKNNI